jgi:hypothetical protein
MSLMLQHFALWLHATTMSRAIDGGVPWIWPACETLHFIGLALLMGCIGIVDLRMVGFVKGLELGPLQRLIPWGIGGFLINLVTGVLFFIGNPGQYVRNIAFMWKLVFLALAGLNVLVFYCMGLGRKVCDVGPDEDAPTAARVIAGASLFFWFGVIYWGRMLPFIGNAF